MAASATSPTTHARTPVHLWIVGGLAVLWNGFGAFDYLMTQLQVEAYMGQFSPEQLEYFYGFPAWAVAAWAVGVWFAFGGSVALLLRSRFAAHLFGISLLGLIATTIYTNVLTDSAEVMEGMGYTIMSIVIWTVLIGLLAYSIWMTRRGVLR